MKKKLKKQKVKEKTAAKRLGLNVVKTNIRAGVGRVSHIIF